MKSNWTRDDIGNWVVEALKDLGGTAHYLQVAKKLWEKHHKDLPPTDDRFFTWQYDMRWASQKLRDDGILLKSKASKLPNGVWKLR